MSRFELACQGKSASAGGMNLPEIKQIAKSMGASTDGLRKDILARICNNSAPSTSTSKRTKERHVFTADDLDMPDRRAEYLAKYLADQNKPIAPAPTGRGTGAGAGAGAGVVAPKRPSQARTISSKSRYIKGINLSARGYYDNFGVKSIGDRCINNPKLGQVKCLTLRKNASPYWAGKPKDTSNYGHCEDWSIKCRDSDFA